MKITTYFRNTFLFSLNISGDLYVEPNYNMSLSEDASGNRDGDFDLGLSYRF